MSEKAYQHNICIDNKIDNIIYTSCGDHSMERRVIILSHKDQEVWIHEGQFFDNIEVAIVCDNLIVLSTNEDKEIFKTKEDKCNIEKYKQFEMREKLIRMEALEFLYGSNNIEKINGFL